MARRLSRQDRADLAFKADLVSKTALNRLHAQGMRGTALRRAFADLLPALIAMIRGADDAFAAARPAGPDLAPSDLADAHPDLDPDIVKWAFEEVVRLLVPARAGDDTPEGGE